MTRVIRLEAPYMKKKYEAQSPANQILKDKIRKQKSINKRICD
jgi:hypothetical protein